MHDADIRFSKETSFTFHNSSLIFFLEKHSAQRIMNLKFIAIELATAVILALGTALPFCVQSNVIASENKALQIGEFTREQLRQSVTCGIYLEKLNRAETETKLNIGGQFPPHHPGDLDSGYCGVRYRPHSGGPCGVAGGGCVGIDRCAIAGRGFFGV